MSADYGTDHFKGYGHLDREPGYIHVTYKADDSALGAFSLADITELVQLAGRAWPDQVEARFEIEARGGYDGTGTNPHQWKRMWSAKLGVGFPDEADSETFARLAFDGMSAGGGVMEWRLVRRTVVSAVEILAPVKEEHDG